MDDDDVFAERGPAGPSRIGAVQPVVPHDGFAESGGVRLLLRKGKPLPKGIEPADVWPAVLDQSGALVPVEHAHRVKGLWRAGRKPRKRTAKGGKK